MLLYDTFVTVKVRGRVASVVDEVSASHSLLTAAESEEGSVSPPLAF